MENLKHLRDAIDTIDERLLGLLNERAGLAREIGRIKEQSGLPVYAPERAEQLMRRLVARNAGPLGERAIRAIYREIMSASIALEKDAVIACSGAVAGRTHLAAKQQFGSSVRYTFHASPMDLFEAVASGRADCGVIPFGEDGPEAAVLELLAGGGGKLCSQILLGGEEGGVAARYLVLGTILNAASGDDQTALLVRLSDHPGALAEALDPFRSEGVNLLSIHSKTARGGGLYLFLEASGHADDEALRRAVEGLPAGDPAVTVCGSYPRAY